jgi:hypothetical protein
LYRLIEKGQTQNERRRKMFTKQRIKLRVLTTGFFIIQMFLLTSCGDQNPTGAGSSIREPELSATDNAGKNLSSSSMKLELGISSKRVNLSESRLLESNLGYQFNSIVPVELDLSPGAALQLEELQPNGIFALYLASDGDFTLSDSDGLNLTLKTVLMEKCSFIDLKVNNNTIDKITVTGFLAGE